MSAISKKVAKMGNVWWVNQKKRGKSAQNEIVWSPSVNEEWHWKTMWDAEIGDTIIHYTDTFIVGTSTVQTRATPAKNPYTDSGDWSGDGKLIVVDYRPFNRPIAKSEIPLQLRLKNSASEYTYAPFDKNGDLNQGYFFKIRPDFAQSLEELFGLTLQSPSTTPQSGELHFNGASDREFVGKSRVEQDTLRRFLIGGRTSAPCGLCGDILPVRYLITAHIKPRSICTETDRKRTEVGMLACIFGCDVAFENGDISVSNTGIISLREGLEDELRDRFQRLEDKKAPVFSSENRRYFQARRKFIEDKKSL